ncbi:hypothetical protein [Arthrobacter sp. NPDC058127]|uniref:CG0192-related protein n=1 Tax=Arthrobacter sp. NPDC058127 TaxID=3346351 RepID=UPI0036ECEE0F
MAIIHRATLSPSKLELIEKYLPVQPWFTQDGSAPPELLGAYRFDDPDGEVGLETHLVSHGGKVYQVPLSYRGSELPGAEDSLLGTMEHSVLGTRWVYDACADPVYVTALATASSLDSGKPNSSWTWTACWSHARVPSRPRAAELPVAKSLH